MLQTISSNHDPHAIRAHTHSIETLTAARSDGKLHLLLTATGSVATIKLPLIARTLSERHCDRLSIRVVLTKSATRFLAGQSAEQPTVDSLRGITGVDAVYEDRDEWGEGRGDGGWRRGKGVLHIELRKWADIMVVAPLSANTLGKIVNGLCDNLLCSIIRAWDVDGSVDGGKRKRIIVCPAMNTAMYLHPITGRQLRVLEDEWGIKGDGTEGAGGAEGGSGWFEVVRPMEKTLACGDVGVGAMRAWEEVVDIIEERMALKGGK